MPKTTKKIVNSSQMSLFELLSFERTERETAAPGRLSVSVRFLAAVKSALKVAPMSRESLADKMSVAIGQEISVHMINAWVSPSHSHRVPAEFLPALCAICGCNEPLRVLAETAGLFTLPGEDALRAEVQKLREQEEKIANERKRRELFLKEMAG